jgi:hypothetical protein
MSMGGSWDVLARFRRAAVLVFVTSGLFLACGVLCGVLPWGTLLTQALQQNPNLKLPPNVSLSQVEVVIRVCGAIPIGAGLVMILLAVFVRKGSRAATLAATILSALFAGFIVLYMLITLISGGAQGGGPAELLMAMCMMTVPALLMGWQFLWLLQAYRSRGQAETAQAQYQAQYWQYLQAQQAYGNAGYRAHAPAPGAEPQSPYAAPPGQAPLAGPGPQYLPPPAAGEPDSGKSPLQGEPPRGDNPS